MAGRNVVANRNDTRTTHHRPENAPNLVTDIAPKPEQLLFTGRWVTLTHRKRTPTGPPGGSLSKNPPGVQHHQPMSEKKFPKENMCNLSTTALPSPVVKTTKSSRLAFRMPLTEPVGNGGENCLIRRISVYGLAFTLPRAGRMPT